MKRIITILTILALVAILHVKSIAQDTIVQWTFPTEAGTADGGIIPANLMQTIETAGGTSAIQFKNGATTKAAQATAWDAGALVKKWKVAFETSGYANLKLSSKISSGGQNPGPRDFIVQYKVVGGSWTDIADSEFQTANDWSTGALNEIPIPDACNDQAEIQIRWLMTSDTATDGSILTPSGISKIDDIFVVGERINGANDIGYSPTLSIFPNPATDFITIKSAAAIQVALFNMEGAMLMETYGSQSLILDVSSFNTGLYIVRITEPDSRNTSTHKINIH